jgi:hypothetical protein
MQFVQLLQQPVARFTRLANFAPLSPIMHLWNYVKQHVQLTQSAAAAGEVTLGRRVVTALAATRVVRNIKIFTFSESDVILQLNFVNMPPFEDNRLSPFCFVRHFV